jgi:hypothetical protein
MRKLDPLLHSMQITIPHSVYGFCEYFLPAVIEKWFSENGIRHPGYAGSNSSGNGFTAGTTNKESVYMVYDIHENDPVAFKIQFPHIKVHSYKL